MTTEFTHKAALVAKSLSQQAGNEEAGAIAGTTDIAGNFAKFTVSLDISGKPSGCRDAEFGFATFTGILLQTCC